MNVREFLFANSEIDNDDLVLLLSCACWQSMFGLESAKAKLSPGFLSLIYDLAVSEWAGFERNRQQLEIHSEIQSLMRGTEGVTAFIGDCHAKATADIGRLANQHMPQVTSIQSSVCHGTP